MNLKECKTVSGFFDSGYSQLPISSKDTGISSTYYYYLKIVCLAFKMKIYIKKPDNNCQK